MTLRPQISELKQFRQWGSKTPGHPENFETEGVEVTTGPLGQGIANAVGLAVAETHLAARFNKPDAKLVDHYTYCIMGDGCNMEGISNEAASLAGHWKLGKLIAFYDDNRISIDGHTSISFTEDVVARYEALGWHTIHVKDGNHDLAGLRDAINEAKVAGEGGGCRVVATTLGHGGVASSFMRPVWRPAQPTPQLPAVGTPTCTQAPKPQQPDPPTPLHLLRSP